MDNGNNVNGVAGIGTIGTNLTSFTQAASLGANLNRIYAGRQDAGGIVAVVSTSSEVFFTGYNGYGQMGLTIQLTALLTSNQLVLSKEKSPKWL